MQSDELFAYHDDLEAYGRALGAYAPGEPMPLLGTHRPVHDVVAGLLGAQAARAAPDATGAVIVSPASSALDPLAGGLAALVDGAHHRIDGPEDLARVPVEHPGAAWVVLVARAGELGDHVVTELHDHLWRAVEDRGFRGHLGLVTTATVEQAAWLVAKGLTFAQRSLPTQADLRVWPAFDAVPARYGSGTWVLRRDATADALGPTLMASHSGVVSFVAHGRDDVIHLHDTVICAAGPDPVALRGDARPNLPVCAFTGRCFRSEIAPERIVRSDAILADVVFSNACMGWRVADGLFPADYLLPSGFASGPAAAYVGAPNLVNGVAALNDIFHLACGRGASVGEAASAVNDHLRYDRGDLPYFTVLGLPWLRTSPSGGSVGTVRSDSAAGQLLVHPGGDGHEGMLAAAARSIAAARHSAGARHVVLTSPRSAPALQVLPSAPTGAPGELTRLREDLRRLGEAITSLEQVPLLGFRYSRQGNLLVTLRDQMSTLSSTLHESVSFGDVGRVTKRVTSLTKAVHRAERGLAEALWERGTTSFVNFDDLWGEVLEQRPPVYAERLCPYCGRSLVRLDAAHPLIPSLARGGLVCSRCCMVFDGDPRGPVEDAVLSCPELWHRGETVEVTLQLTCRAQRRTPVAALVGVHTEACARNGVSFSGIASVELHPGKTHEVRTTARVHEDAHMHQEYLRAFVVGDGTVSIATRPVYVRPAKTC